MGKNKNKAKKQQPAKEQPPVKEAAKEVSIGTDDTFEQPAPEEEEVRETPQEKADKYRAKQLEQYHDFLASFKDEELALGQDPPVVAKELDKREKEELKRVDKLHEINQVVALNT